MFQLSSTTVRMSQPLRFSLASGNLLLLAMMFQWDIIDLLTPFLWMPLIALAWFLVSLAAIWSIWYVIRHRSKGRSAIVPLAVSCGTLLAVFLVPFNDFWLYGNFHLKKRVGWGDAGTPTSRICYSPTLTWILRDR